MGSVTEGRCVSLRFQGLHLSGCGPARGVARLRHEPASRAAYLVWRRVHVRPARVPLVGSQDGGGFRTESLTLLNNE